MDEIYANKIYLNDLDLLLASIALVAISVPHSPQPHPGPSPPSTPPDLGSAFSTAYVYMNVTAVIVQLFLTSFIMKKFGLSIHAGS